MLKDRNYSKLAAQAARGELATIQPRTGRIPEGVHLVPVKVLLLDLGEYVEPADGEACDIAGLDAADRIYAFTCDNSGFFDIPGVSYVLYIWCDVVNNSTVFHVEICQCVESYEVAENLCYYNRGYYHEATFTDDGLMGLTWFSGMKYCGPLYQ